MSGSNGCFLTCIHISQEAGKVVLYSHLFKNVSQFVVIHIVKGFSVVNEAEVDVFLEFSCFFYDLMDVGNLISGSSAFTKPSLYIWKFSVQVLLKPVLENFEHYFANTWNVCNCAIVWTFFGILFSGIGMKLLFSLSCSYCWFFHICWHIECHTLTTSSFRVWNNSAGIPSPPLALFIVMPPKAHLKLQSLVLGVWWHHCGYLGH